MHPAQLYGGFWTIFFLLSVQVALKKKKKKKKKKIMIPYQELKTIMTRNPHWRDILSVSAVLLDLYLLDLIQQHAQGMENGNLTQEGSHAIV